MNKIELIREISERTESTQKEVADIIDTFVDVVREELKKDGEVKLVGFGKFSVKERKERMARNIQTGEPIKVPARKVPNFKISKTFLD